MAKQKFLDKFIINDFIKFYICEIINIIHKYSNMIKHTYTLPRVNSLSPTNIHHIVLLIFQMSLSTNTLLLLVVVALVSSGPSEKEALPAAKTGNMNDDNNAKNRDPQPKEVSYVSINLCF